MKRTFYIIGWLLISIFPLKAIAPADTTTQEPSSHTSKHALYTGVGYGSDMLYSGYSLSGNQPYYSADIFYSYNRKWSASVMLYNLNAEKPAITFYDIAIGYRHIFNSWWDVRASLASYFTAKSVQDTYFGNFSYLSVSPGFDWRILYTRIIYSTIVDNNNSHYLQIKNSHYFSTSDFWDGNAFMDFNPAINFVFGDKYKLQTNTTNNSIPGVGQTTETTEELTKSFGMMDMELSIPVSFNYKNATLEAEPLFYIPVHKDPDYPAQEGFHFFINLYFRIL